MHGVAKGTISKKTQNFNFLSESAARLCCTASLPARAGAATVMSLPHCASPANVRIKMKKLQNHCTHKLCAKCAQHAHTTYSMHKLCQTRLGVAAQVGREWLPNRVRSLPKMRVRSQSVESMK